MTLIVHWKPPGHGTNVEESISVIVVLVCSKHIGQHVFGCFDAARSVIKISYEFFWLFRDHLGFFYKNGNQILNNVIIKFHDVNCPLEARSWNDGRRAHICHSCTCVQQT